MDMSRCENIIVNANNESSITAVGKISPTKSRKMDSEGAILQELSKLLPNKSRSRPKNRKHNTKAAIVTKCTRYIEYLLIVAWKLAGEFDIAEEEFLQTLASENCSLNDDILLMLDLFRPLSPHLKPKRELPQRKSYQGNSGSAISLGSSFVPKKSDVQYCKIISLARSEKILIPTKKRSVKRTTTFTQTDENIEEFISSVEKRSSGKRSKSNSEDSASAEKTNSTQSCSFQKYPNYGVGINLFPDSSCFTSWDIDVQAQQDDMNWLCDIFGDNVTHDTHVPKQEDSTKQDLFDTFDDTFFETKVYHPSYDHYYGKEHPIVVEPKDSCLHVLDFDENSKINNVELSCNPFQGPPSCTENIFDASFLDPEPVNSLPAQSIAAGGNSGSLIHPVGIPLLSPLMYNSMSRLDLSSHVCSGLHCPPQNLNFSPRLFLNLPCTEEHGPIQ